MTTYPQPRCAQTGPRVITLRGHTQTARANICRLLASLKYGKYKPSWDYPLGSTGRSQKVSPLSSLRSERNETFSSWAIETARTNIAFFSLRSKDAILLLVGFLALWAVLQTFRALASGP